MDTTKLTETMIERIKYILLEQVLYQRFGKKASMWEYKGFGSDDRRADAGLAKRGIIMTNSRWNTVFTPEGLAWATENYGALANSFADKKSTDESFRKAFIAAWHDNEHAKGYVETAKVDELRIVHRTGDFTLEIYARKPFLIRVDARVHDTHEEVQAFLKDFSNARILATILEREAKLILDSLE